MRIAYLCADFGIPVYGSKGAAIHVRELSRTLHSLGHEVLILSPRLGGQAPADFAVPVRELALEGPEGQVCDLLRDDPAAGAPTAKEVRALLYAVSLRHRAAAALRAFAPQIIYERYSLFGTGGMALARELRVPHLLEVNAPLSEEQATHRGLVFAGTARGLEGTVLRAADRVIAVSRELRDWLIGVGVAPERVTVLPNGVDMGRFEATAQAREEIRGVLGLTDRPVVGFLGTLKPWHGTGTLLRAVALLHRSGLARDLAPRLLIVGEGPERADLETAARREGIAEAVIFTGAVPHERVPAYLAAMDIAVAPYGQVGHFYFSPLKLFEYMAAGRPVVAAAIGQIRECIRHGETGWLYPPGDVDALADALGGLLSDEALARALGRAGREYVRRHHTWEGNARAVLDLAGPLLTGARGGS